MPTILEEAQKIVDGARKADYGTPYENWTLTASLVNAMLCHKFKQALTAEDLIMIMLQVKIAREIHKPKRDSRVDLAGYAQCLDEVHNERERRTYMLFDEVTKKRFENDLNWADRATGAFGDTKEEWLKETR